MAPRNLGPKILAGTGLAAAGLYAGQEIRFRREGAKRPWLSDRPAPGTPAFSCLVESWCGGAARGGNRVDVLRNGDQIFPSMLDAIASATRTVVLSSYIFWKGETASVFGEALAARARAGVEVDVLVDAWGSARMDRALVERMEAAGVSFVWFRSPHWYTLDKLNNRSHRRIAVIDGAVGFTGGLGIADEWAGDADRPGNWRETHLRIRGPAVRDLVGAFADNWEEETGRVLAGAHLPELQPFDDGVEVQITRSAARQGRAAAEALWFAAVSGCRERLWSTTAYFAPRRAMVDALIDAAGRGVDVRIVVNGPHIDKEVVRRVGHACYVPLLEAGVRIFEYQPTMMHAKVTVADDGWANVGTANLDNRSLALQDEMNCSIASPRVVAELEKHFFDDFADSTEIDLVGWRERPRRARAYEAVSEWFQHSL